MNFNTAAGDSAYNVGGAIMGSTDLKANHWQTRLVTEDGAVTVYNKAVTEWFQTIRLKAKSKTALTALITWFHTTNLWSSTAFAIEPDANLDLGAGFGVKVLVNLWQDTLEVKYDVPGSVFYIDILCRTYSTGTALPAYTYPPPH